MILSKKYVVYSMRPTRTSVQRFALTIEQGVNYSSTLEFPVTVKLSASHTHAA